MTTSPRTFLALLVLVVVPATASAQQVLVYGTLPSGELPWYSGFGGLSITTVTEGTWSSMTTAQFQAYDLIWIGGINSTGSSPAPYATLNATKPTWSAAINGRIVVHALHIAATVHATAGAMTFVDDALTWLLAGGGTALYAGQDVGLDQMNYMSEFGISGCAGVNCFNTNEIHVITPPHPVMMNSTDAGLSNWSQSAHNQLVSFPPEWTVLCTGGMTAEPLVLVRDFACNLEAPLTSPIVGDGDITFNAFEPAGNDVDTLFEYSLDGGLTWQLCTASLASPVANPGTVSTPALGAIFVWDTVADGVGVVFPTLPIVRLTITSTGTLLQTSCSRSYAVDNVQPIPGCLISMPLAGTVVSGARLIQFVPTNPLGGPMDVEFEWSTDGGMSFAPATDAGGGSLTGNPTVAPISGASESWNWQTAADLPGNPMNVTLRITVTDPAFMLSSACQVVVNVANAPTCMISSPLPLATVAGPSVAIKFTAQAPTGGQLTARFLFSVDMGLTYQMATGAGGGTVTGNPTSPFLPGPFVRTWVWDTEADILGHVDPVLIRVEVTDIGTGTSSVCDRGIIVDNMLCTLLGLCGDCDGDGRVTVLDSHEIARISAGLAIMPSFGSDRFNACNVWGEPAPLVSAGVGIADALQIARHVVGLIPIECCVP